MKQAAKIIKEIYRTALLKCVAAAVPAVFSCKVCSSLERWCSHPSELQKHYSKGPVCYDTHRVLKFNPVFWICRWAPAEVSGNVEESFPFQLHCSDPAGKTRNAGKVTSGSSVLRGQRAAATATGSLGTTTAPTHVGCCSSAPAPFWIPNQECF